MCVCGGGVIILRVSILCVRVRVYVCTRVYVCVCVCVWLGGEHDNMISEGDRDGIEGVGVDTEGVKVPLRDPVPFVYVL